MNFQSIVKPLVPLVPGWMEIPVSREDQLRFSLGYPLRAFIHPENGFFVMSAVEVAIDAPGMEPNGPEYHLSMSRRGNRPGGVRRVTSEEARMILIQFGADGALEDNHVPSGNVRNFWRPVAEPNVGEVCACQESEPEIREDKGDFVWRPAP